MFKFLHYNPMDRMHTDPDTIDVISMYGVYHNFTYHVDKYEVHNSDLILRIIQYIVPISNTYSHLDWLVSNDELHIMHTETRMSARSNFGQALQKGSWEQWSKEAGKISSHNSKVGRCQYDCNFEDNSCNIQCHHKNSRAIIFLSCCSRSSQIPVNCVLHSRVKFPITGNEVCSTTALNCL